MVKIVVGEEYTAGFVRHGTKNGNPWQLIRVKDEQGRRTVHVWADNAPTGIQEGAKFRIDSISGVKYTSKRFNDKWVDEVDVTAHLTQTQSRDEAEASSSTFSELAGDDEELPF